MIYRAPDYPKCYDWAFYRDREPVDHWNQSGFHHDRLEHALRLGVEFLTTAPLPGSMADFACGTGGLLHQFARCLPATPCWGYDISPLAVAFAREHYKVQVFLEDITEQGLIPEYFIQALLSYPISVKLLDVWKDILNSAPPKLPYLKKQAPIRYPEFLILTETLEHLLNPFELLIRCRQEGVKAILASVPANEGPECSEHHNWAWTEDSFPGMFEMAGYGVSLWEEAFNTQYMIARAR